MYYTITMWILVCYWMQYVCDNADNIFYQNKQFKNSYDDLFISFFPFFNKPETLYNIIRFPSPQFCSLMIEIIVWNSLNDYSKSLRVIE